MSQQIKNRTIFTRDNSEVLRAMDSESVDLIYLDPPFNSNRNYAAPVGSKAAGAQFKDAWTLDDVDIAWVKQIKTHHPKLREHYRIRWYCTGGDQSYLTYMAIRLLEMHRILKESGSLYLHCDPTMSHSLKLLLDSIFGKNNFRNEIIWYKGYRGTPRKRRWQQEHDTLFFYSKTANYIWCDPKGEYKDKDMKRYNKINEEGEKYALIKRRRTDGTVYYGKTYPKGKKAGDVIDLPLFSSNDKERTGYPTQKPKTLLKKIIEASSNEGDLVLDPFCGCATTCIAAEELNRQWIGIDISEKAVELVKMRLNEELMIGDKDNPSLIHNDPTGEYTVIHRTDIPKRTDELKRSKNIKETLYGKQGGNCNGCGGHFQIRNLDIDHIIAKSRGGQDTDENLQLLCPNCNSVKGSKDMAYLIARLEERGSKSLSR